MRVVRTLDDGCGKKVNEEYGVAKRGDQVEYEFENAVINDLNSN